MKKRALVLIFAMLAWNPGLARAQSDSVGDSPESAAEAISGPARASEEDVAALVAEATEAFQAGDFAGAAAIFERAFALDPHPVILFNMARAYQQAGAFPTALLHFRSLRSLNADQRVLDSAATRIAEIEEALRAQGYDPAEVTSESYVPRGTLTVNSQPEGASVFLGNDFRGVTPLVLTLVDQGRYRVRVDLEGFHPVTTDVPVEGLKNTVRSFELERRTSLEEYVPPDPGLLTLEGAPGGVSVLIDGMLFGSTPFVSEPITPGSYILTLEGPTWETYTTAIEVVSGETLTVRVSLTSLLADEIAKKEKNQQRTGIALMSAGGGVFVAGLGVALAASGQAKNYRDNRDDPDRAAIRTRARTLAAVADTLMVAGLGLTAAGIPIHLKSKRKQADEFDGLVLTPSIGFGSAHVRLQF